MEARHRHPVTWPAWRFVFWR